MDLETIIFLTVFTGASLFMVSFLLISGQFLSSMKNYQKDMKRYWKHRKRYSPFRRFFLDVFYVMTALDREWALKWFGNEFLTHWYQVSRFVFYVLAALFFFGWLAVWMLVLTNL